MQVFILKNDYAPDAGSKIYGVYSTIEKAYEAMERYESEDNEYGKGCDSLDVVCHSVE